MFYLCIYILTYFPNLWQFGQWLRWQFAFYQWKLHFLNQSINEEYDQLKTLFNIVEALIVRIDLIQWTARNTKLLIYAVTIKIIIIFRFSRSISQNCHSRYTAQSHPHSSLFSLIGVNANSNAWKINLNNQSVVYDPNLLNWMLIKWIWPTNLRNWQGKPILLNESTLTVILMVYSNTIQSKGDMGMVIPVTCINDDVFEVQIHTHLPKIKCLSNDELRSKSWTIFDDLPKYRSKLCPPISNQSKSEFGKQ